MKKNKKNVNITDDELFDPLENEEGLGSTPSEPVEDSSQDEEPKRRRSIFTSRKKQILHPEDLDDMMPEGDDDFDTNQIISSYIAHRRARLFGLRLLRLDRVKLGLLAALLLIAFFFILSFLQEKMGNFTINLDRLELYRKGIAMSADAEFTNPTARLVATSVDRATNITITDLPTDIDDIDGDHNGVNYMAYTYYVRNAGKEDVYYVADVVLTDSAKGADKAVRVAIWNNGERTVYAAPSASGEPEDGCVNFLSDKLVCSFREEEFKVGYVNKYTIVIWLEGEDPECIDDIVGGSVEFVMSIHADNDENTSLLWKYYHDIVDTLTGNDPISAAGTESPDFQLYSDVTWETRRNKDNVQ